MLTLLEHFLTFKPNTINHGALDLIKHQRLRIGASFGFDLDAAWLPCSSDAAVLFLHGNRHNITRFYDHYALFQRLGISCLTFDYPGYGTSAGSPSETALYGSARAAFSHIVNDFGFKPHQIAIYGCSLGGAVAIELAKEASAGCLITESTFTNSHDIARFLYPYLPVTRFLKRRFANDALVGKIRIPKLLIHGSEDPRVPVYMAETLHEKSADPKNLIIIPEADHVNCVQKGGPLLHSQIGDFIRKHCTSSHF
jgi:pimeloyl-ACP methyl ester carboxylesterase